MVECQSMITHSVGSTPTVGKIEIGNSTQSETEELLMMNISSKVKLKMKWIVGLLVLITLGVCGVCPTRSNVSSFGL